MTADIRTLADEVHERSLAAQPFLATTLGVPGYDALVTDLSAAAEASLTSVMTALREQAQAIDVASLDAGDRITHAAVLNTIDGLLASTAARGIEHTLSTLGEGPSALFMLAAQTRLSSAEQAADLLTRMRGYPGYLATQVDRLQQGAAAGRLPVETLVRVAVEQVDGYLTGEGDDVLADVAPPPDWDGAAAWSAQLRTVVEEQVRPALRAWRQAVAALPSRSDDRCGLVHLPGGVEDYAHMIALHTTLPLTAQQVHDLGQTSVTDLISRMTTLGAQLGLVGYPAVRDAIRNSAADSDAEQAMTVSRDAVRRAEAVLAEVFSEPLPPPCRVAAMSEHLARAGMPPHYTPPKPDGSVGTYWFNAEQAEPGGWDLEATAYHEAVPGHHLQMARSLALTDVPSLQSQSQITAYQEGWALYAEVLAGELGLYSSIETQLGSLSAQLFRAGRLVVDTGIHALGWTRDEAVRWFTETVPSPEPFLADEVNRDFGLPGQALGYLVGQRELLRLRADAQERLGDRFALAGFHGAVLDSGNLPLPAVATAVDAWIATLEPA